MAVVRLEIKTRQPLADGRKFDQVGCYEQLDGTAHFAVDPAHRLNCAVTDIDLAERGRDGLVHFTADVRILRGRQKQITSARAALEAAQAAYEAAKRNVQRLDDKAEEVVQAQVRAAYM